MSKVVIFHFNLSEFQVLKILIQPGSSVHKLP